MTGIDYNGYSINVVEYEEDRKYEIKKGMKKGKMIPQKKDIVL